MNLFAMDQGALLECFWIHGINCKVVGEQKTSKTA